MGLETLGKVRDGSRDPWGGPGLVGGPMEGSETGWGPSGRSGTDQGTLREVRDGSVERRGGTERVG